MPTYPYLNGIYSFFRTPLASSPLFMISIFVKHPIDLSPDASISLIILRASLVDKSWLAGTTHKIMERGSLM